MHAALSSMRVNFYFSLLVCLALAPTPSLAQEEDPYKKYWIAHGVCASVAWTILIPLAIGSAVLRKQFVQAGCTEAVWFQVHRTLNLIASLLTIVAFALAVYVVRQEDGRSNWTEIPHFTVGLVIFLATLLQVMFALVRPPHHHDVNDTEQEVIKAEELTIRQNSDEDDSAKELPARPEPHGKVSLRRVWEHAHRFVGVGLLATAWWQIQNGWGLYESEIGGQDQGKVFLATAAGISGTFVIIFLVHKAGELYGSKK